MDELQAGGARLWRELELWTTWNEHVDQFGHDEPSFHSWLDESKPGLGGFPRREALERKAPPCSSHCAVKLVDCPPLQPSAGSVCHRCRHWRSSSGRPSGWRTAGKASLTVFASWL
jgi:hypothetical protein